jgi:transcriptional regulator with XRE-family HTH domain
MIDKPFIFEWSGRDADALRRALRMTQEQMANQLGCSPRTMTRWCTGRTTRISQAVQEALDALYERLTEQQVRRFLYALQNGPEPRQVSSPVVMAAEMALMQARIDELTAQLEKERQS